FLPSNTACLAAANVPECHIEFPRLGPMLIPDNTTWIWFFRCVPNATQSAGVPFTRYASIFSLNSTGDFLQDNGLEWVTAWPIDDCSTSGATTITSPNLEAIVANALIPGL